jgi:hypothetical protein
MRHDPAGTEAGAAEAERWPTAEHLAILTRRYARFSRSAGGLASVLGGGLALVAYLAGALSAPEGLWGRLALASAPFVWIGAKEVLRRRYYQPLGRVEQPRTAYERRWHLGFTIFTAIVSVAVVAVVLWETVVRGRGLPPAGVLGYLAIVAVMPVLVWHFMKTPLEFIVGVFLVCQAALMLGGTSYALWEQPQAPIAAVALVGLGIKQHLEFLSLRSELARLPRADRTE